MGHRHVDLEPGETKTIEYSIRRKSGSPETAKLPRIMLQAEYLGKSSRIKIPESTTSLPLLLDRVPTDHFRGAVNRCADITLNRNSAIGVNSDQFKLPDGPMTLEAWVKPKSLQGYNAIIAKTESSEYALFSDEGVPQFDIHLGGKYVTAKAVQKMKVNQWTHLAGVYDGKQVKMFVDGELVGSLAGKGQRRSNKLPLWIGADPNGRGQPTRPLPAWIDEVRVSKSARYDGSFLPSKRFAPDSETVLLMHLDRNIGPFVLDHSESSAKGLFGVESNLVPATKR